MLLAHRADAQNLVPDPQFAAGVSGWVVTPGRLFVFDPSVSRRAGSGSGRLSLVAGDFAELSLCLPASPGTNYSWGYAVMSSQAGVFGVPALIFFSGPGCSGPSLGGVVEPSIGPIGGSFHGYAGPNLVAPPGTVSAHLVFYLFPGPQMSLWIDDVFFGPAGTIPPFLDVVG